MQRPLLQVNKFGADISKSQLEHRDRFSARWELRIVPERSSAGESTSSWVEAGIWKEQVQWIPKFTVIYSPLRFLLTINRLLAMWFMEQALSITERTAFIWYLDHDGLSNLQPWSWPWSTKAGLNCLSLMTNRGTIFYSDGASYQAWATVSPIASI